MVTQAQRDSIKHKFSRYTREQCEYALMDIRETLELLGPHHHDQSYIEKLFHEKDEAWNRMRKLIGTKTCPCCQGDGYVKENA